MFKQEILNVKKDVVSKPSIAELKKALERYGMPVQLSNANFHIELSKISKKMESFSGIFAGEP